MKTLGNIFIAGLVILLIGVVVLVVALGLNDWSFEGSIDFETKTFTAENSGISNLDITINAGPAHTEFYDGDKIIIEYPEHSRFKPTITEKTDTLVFRSGTYKWYDVSFWGSFQIPETVIKLPKNIVFNLDMVLNAGSLDIEGGTYNKTEIKVNAGKLKLGNGTYGEMDVTVNAGSLNGGNITTSAKFSGKVSAGSLKIESVTCPEIDTKVSAGSLKIESVTCPEINAKVSAGSLNLKIEGKESEYSISVDKSAGDCDVESQRGTTDKWIDIDISAGSATIKFSDD